jgi:Flp pilus assembly protein TadG
MDKMGAGTNLKNMTWRESGGAMIEFALIAPLLILFIFGIVQYGQIYSAQITLGNAAAAGARYAALTNPAPTATQVENVIKASISPLNVKALTTKVELAVNVGGVANSKRVTLNYNLPLLFPFIIPGITGKSFPISVTNVMN